MRALFISSGRSTTLATLLYPQKFGPTLSATRTPEQTARITRNVSIEQCTLCPYCSRTIVCRVSAGMPDNPRSACLKSDLLCASCVLGVNCGYWLLLLVDRAHIVILILINVYSVRPFFVVSMFAQWRTVYWTRNEHHNRPNEGAHFSHDFLLLLSRWTTTQVKTNKQERCASCIIMHTYRNTATIRWI